MILSLHQGWLDEECADTRLGRSERIAGAIEGFVVGVVLGTEGAEGFFAAPAIDRNVTTGDVCVFEEFRAEILRRASEESCPGTFGAVSRLEVRDLVFSDVELPQDDEHELSLLLFITASIALGKWPGA
jgi:hypothetical protein